MAGAAPRNPFVEYADDKKNPDNYVRIGVDIKGLKKKLVGKGASNASIQFEVAERSFTLRVDLKLKGKSELYEYSIKQLPEAISTDEKKTYWKIKKDEEIIVMLHKVKADSWTRYFSSSGPGLETAD